MLGEGVAIFLSEDAVAAPDFFFEFDDDGLGDEANVLGVLDPLEMGRAEAFEFAGEFRVVGEVVEFVRIGLAVVEFFVGFGGVEEFFGVGLELPGFVKGSNWFAPMSTLITRPR